MRVTVIVKNSIKCNKCEDIIESKHRHDFVFCSCGAVAADGGREYLRRVGDLDGYTELSEERYDETIPEG